MSGTRQALIVAGEVSGDIHAGNLLRELSRLAPGLQAFGVGGERLSAAGLEIVVHSSELAHMGLVEVLRELPRLRRIFKDLVDLAARRRPSVAVLVDSPDFNLRLARRLARLDIPVVLYVSPQLWAWRSRRVRIVRRVAREVLCILPFEVDFYRRHGVAARFVGHPLVDDLAREGFVGRPGAAIPGRIALLPGSRGSEVRQLLPVMLAALGRLTPDIVEEAVVIVAPGVEPEVRTVMASMEVDPRLRVVTGAARRRDLAASTFAWTASGTATLECALLGVPMIVGYRLNRISYLIASRLVKVPNIALANLITGQAVFPELIQDAWTADRLAGKTRDALSGDLSEQRRALSMVQARLGKPGASVRAARAVASYLGPTTVGQVGEEA